MAQAMRQISLVGELEADVEIKASAKKFHQLLAGRPHDIAKATPDNVKGCGLREGEFGKVGSVIVWNYVVVLRWRCSKKKTLVLGEHGQPKVTKERIEAVDPEKNLIALRTIEGDRTKEFKSFLITVQATQKQRGPGSVVKCNFKYERTDEKVAHPENLLAVLVKVFKDMGEMLSSEV